MKKLLKILLTTFGIIILLIGCGIFLFLQSTKLQTLPENAKSENIPTGKWVKIASENTLSTDGSQRFGTMKK